MDASELSSRVNDGFDAIIVYHLFGGTSDMHTIIELAGDIPIVEVLTYSLGARIGDRYAGTLCTVALHVLLTTDGAYGDAGMIWTSESPPSRKDYVKFALRIVRQMVCMEPLQEAFIRYHSRCNSPAQIWMLAKDDEAKV